MEAYVPVAPLKVTKSPLSAPCAVAATVTVVVPFAVNGSVPSAYVLM